MSQKFRLLFRGDGLTDCVEIWYAFGDPLDALHAVVTGGVSPHMRMYTPRICISGMAWPIVFKFGVRVGVMNYVLFGTNHGRGIFARAHVHTVISCTNQL